MSVIGDWDFLVELQVAFYAGVGLHVLLERWFGR